MAPKTVIILFRTVRQCLLNIYNVHKIIKMYTLNVNIFGVDIHITIVVACKASIVCHRTKIVIVTHCRL